MPLELETHLRLDDSVPKAKNLCSRFTEDDLGHIGAWVWDGYTQDENSRSDWHRRIQAAMDLATQLQKAKSFPWADCANVAFPLVTIAALQFHARAYPAIIQGTQIVKCRVPGPDPSGEATLRAERVGTYMSYQVLEEDQAWEEQHDGLLLRLPIVGCEFVKTQHLASKGHNISTAIPATSLCMDYYAKSVDSCSRKTQIIPFYRNEVHERCKSGVWKDITNEDWYKQPSMPYTPRGKPEEDQRKGLHPPPADEATPLTFLEQHCLIDFDQDGYQEPYIVTIEANSKKVVRIVARWDSSADIDRNPSGQVVRIRAEEMYTKYGLIPSPDGSIYDMGFGVLLGPLNESANSIVNMLMDAGTMAVASGGFLSRGVKIRGGVYQFSPFQWNRVDSSGDDLNKGIVPLPVREPSEVLFKLLTFLVQYTQIAGGSTDAIQGQNPGQNTPAQTQQSMVEQGMKIYSALFKRVWRSMKGEFSKLYILNAKTLPVKKSFGVGGSVAREDFLGDPSQVVPVADPNVTSDLMRLQQAMAIGERAHQVNGYDLDKVERNILSAMRVDGVEQIYPGPGKVPPLPNPKVMLERAKSEGKLALDKAKGEREQQQFVIEMMMEQQLNAANIVKIEAQAALYAAQADGEPQGKEIELVNAMLGAAKARDESLRSHIDLMLKGLQTAGKLNEQRANGDGAGGAPAGAGGAGGGGAQ